MKPDSLHPPILETERLRLRPLARTDAPDIHPLLDDPEVMAFWDVPEVGDPELVEEIVLRQVAHMERGEAIHWSIRTLNEDRLIGACDLSEIDRFHKRADVGFMLGREAWGQGYAAEALRAMIAYAGSSGVKKLTARTHLGNRRSESLLERFQFRKEGLLRGHIVRAGERRDCHVFGLLL